MRIACARIALRSSRRRRRVQSVLRRSRRMRRRRRAAPKAVRDGERHGERRRRRGEGHAGGARRGRARRGGGPGQRCAVGRANGAAPREGRRARARRLCGRGVVRAVQALQARDRDGRLDDKLAKTTLLVFDADRDTERLASAGYKFQFIPYVGLPRRRRPSDRLGRGAREGQRVVARADRASSRRGRPRAPERRAQSSRAWRRRSTSVGSRVGAGRTAARIALAVDAVAGPGSTARPQAGGLPPAERERRNQRPVSGRRARVPAAPSPRLRRVVARRALVLPLAHHDEHDDHDERCRRGDVLEPVRLLADDDRRTRGRLAVRREHRAIAPPRRALERHARAERRALELDAHRSQRRCRRGAGARRLEHRVERRRPPSGRSTARATASPRSTQEPKRSTTSFATPFASAAPSDRTTGAEPMPASSGGGGSLETFPRSRSGRRRRTRDGPSPPRRASPRTRTDRTPGRSRPSRAPPATCTRACPAPCSTRVIVESGNARDPEVRDLRAGPREEDVLRLDVAVDDPGGVRERERASRARARSSRRPRAAVGPSRRRSRRLSGPSARGPCTYSKTRNRPDGVVLAHVVQRDDVRMAHRGGRLRLVAHARRRARRARTAATRDCRAAP